MSLGGERHVVDREVELHVVHGLSPQSVPRVEYGGRDHPSFCDEFGVVLEVRPTKDGLVVLLTELTHPLASSTIHGRTQRDAKRSDARPGADSLTDAARPAHSALVA